MGFDRVRCIVSLVLAPSCRLLAVAVAVSVGFGVAGCGSGDDGDAAPPVTEAVEAAGDGAADVEIVADDYVVEEVPETLPLGSRLTLVNRSDRELHELVIAPLHDGDDRPIPELLALGEALQDELAGPPSVLIAMPGADGEPVLGDGVLGAPGRYLLVCFIPVGADPVAYAEAAMESDGPPEGFVGPPHAAEGMVAEITVTG